MLEAGDGGEALELVTAENPDLVVLDVNLPSVGGFDVLSQLRLAHSVPVIMVTGRDGETDRVLGLELGADDYVVKPFSPRELASRVRAILRRSSPPETGDRLDFVGLRIDLNSREVLVEGRSVSLTTREFDLLAFLASSPRRVYSRASCSSTCGRRHSNGRIPQRSPSTYGGSGSRSNRIVPVLAGSGPCGGSVTRSSPDSAPSPREGVEPVGLEQRAVELDHVDHVELGPVVHLVELGRVVPRLHVGANLGRVERTLGSGRLGRRRSALVAREPVRPAVVVEAAAHGHALDRHPRLPAVRAADDDVRVDLHAQLLVFGICSYGSQGHPEPLLLTTVAQLDPSPAPAGGPRAWSEAWSVVSSDPPTYRHPRVRTGERAQRGRERGLWRARAVAAIVVLSLAPLAALTPRAVADTVTMSAGPDRSSWYANQPGLAPSSIDDADFGRLFSTSLDGQVYAQPLVSQGTLLAVTENNSVYGMDPVTGSVAWHHNYGFAFDPAVLGCGDLSPKVGITATPVIDPATDIAYFTSKIATAADSSSSAWYLHAVNVATGVEQAPFPVLIHGNASNDAGTTFNPQYELSRTGLALVNGVVYVGFGGHCDHPPYLGWVVGVSTAGTITSMWADETAQSSGGAAGLWQSGAAPVVDASGRLFFVSGNGTTPAAGPALGQPQPRGLGECVFALNTTTTGHVGQLSISDWFCPKDAAQLNSFDGDFGSGGPAELPASFESATDDFPLMVADGKEGELYLLDMNDLGGVGQGPGGTDKVVAEVGPYGGVWSKPAVWGGDGGYVYLPTASPGAAGGGTSGNLDVFQRVVDGAGNVGLSLVAQAASPFGFSSSSPVVTSDGTTSGSALVWIVHAADASGVGATLQAYAALPQGGVLQQLWSAPLGNPGTGAKFNPPAVDAGRVYVGTRDGTIVGFGALAGAPPLAADLVSFPPTSLGNSAPASATFTASGPVTVNSISVDNATSAQTPVFAAGATDPALPASLTAGQTLTVPLTFSPAAIGLETGTLTANTGAGAVDLPLSGLGAAPTAPISSTPPAVDFGTHAIGGSPASTTITFTNTGADPFTVTGVDDPVGPFTITDPPATDGSVTVAPGDSIGLGVTFTPPATSGNFTQTFTAQLTLETDVGDVLVPVRGAAAPPAQISISPAALHFGAVSVGQAELLSFRVSNTGGTPLTILKSKPPVNNRFAAVTTLAEGTVIPPHGSVLEKVRFAPTTTGALSDQWIVNGNDDTGSQRVLVSGSGVHLATMRPPASGGWRMNGSAAMRGSVLQLTPVAPLRAGSAFWPHSVSSKTVNVSFDETSTGGTGADGLTLAFADAAHTHPSALGGNGDELGFGGLPRRRGRTRHLPEPHELVFELDRARDRAQRHELAVAAHLHRDPAAPRRRAPGFRRGSGRGAVGHGRRLRRVLGGRPPAAPGVHRVHRRDGLAHRRAQRRARADRDDPHGPELAGHRCRSSRARRRRREDLLEVGRERGFREALDEHGPGVCRRLQTRRPPQVPDRGRERGGVAHGHRDQRVAERGLDRRGGRGDDRPARGRALEHLVRHDAGCLVARAEHAEADRRTPDLGGELALRHRGDELDAGAPRRAREPQRGCKLLGLGALLTVADQAEGAVLALIAVGGEQRGGTRDGLEAVQRDVREIPENACVVAGIGLGDEPRLLGAHPQHGEVPPAAAGEARRRSPRAPVCRPRRSERSNTRARRALASRDPPASAARAGRGRPPRCRAAR